MYNYIGVQFTINRNCPLRVYGDIEAVSLYIPMRGIVCKVREVLQFTLKNDLFYYNIESNKLN